jgi:hypothetical protein
VGGSVDDPFEAAVIRPFPLTVILAFVKLPTLEFTVASVKAFDPDVVASPLISAPVIAEPLPRTSPTSVEPVPVPPCIIGRYPLGFNQAKQPVVTVAVPAVHKLKSFPMPPVAVANGAWYRTDGTSDVVHEFVPRLLTVPPTFAFVAVIVPDPVVPRLAPVPTNPAIDVFVPDVRAENDVPLPFEAAVICPCAFTVRLVLV